VGAREEGWSDDPAPCASWAMAEGATETGTRRQPRVAVPTPRRSPTGVVLHTTPWRETSLIVELSPATTARRTCRPGAKRPDFAVPRPCSRLLLRCHWSWSGRNEIKKSRPVEWIGGLTLRGNALLAAFYANELVVRLLARADPHERLFDTTCRCCVPGGGAARHHVASVRDAVAA